jgi:glycine reductase
MDAENQTNILRLAEEYGKDRLIVVLGAADAEGVEISAETLISGDPSFAGPLAGVQLGLQVYHILEPELRKHIPEEIYRKHLAIFEMVIEADKIGESLAKLRDQGTK